MTTTGETECPQCRVFANMLMSGMVFVHEHKIAEVDEALRPFLGVEDASKLGLPEM
jgi:hypothetical protein